MRHAPAFLCHALEGLPRAGHAAAAAVAGSCGLFLLLALSGIAAWQWDGKATWVDFWFKQVGGPLLVAYAVAEVIATGSVARWFAPGEPMRRPWRLLQAASVTHAASTMFRHWFGAPIASNPLALLPGAPFWIEVSREFGRVLGGTLWLALLAAGLGLALRVHARLGLLRSPGVAGWLTIAAAGALLAYTLRSLVYWLGVPSVRSSALWWIGWITDPLLGLLLVLSILLARSSAPLAGGMLAWPWRAYYCAALLTCIGSPRAGIVNSGLMPPSALWPSWLVWHPAAALFALAPLWQLRAMAASARPEPGRDGLRQRR
jgi:hypothetical protein